MDTLTWVDRETASADLGDVRRTERFKIILSNLIEKPSGPISRSCDTREGKKAAYRFFGSRSVTDVNIMFSHFERTAERAVGHEVILNVQDTTYFNFNSHKATQGLGRIGDDKHGAKGLSMHSGYAFSENGVPLGMTSHKISSRKPSDFKRQSPARKRQIRRMPSEEKESYRWIEAVDHARELLPASAHIIHVCDREADFYNFMEACADRNSSFLLRAKNERMVLVDGDEGEEVALSDVMERSPVRATTTVTLLGNGDRDVRRVKLDLHHQKVTMSPPRRSEQIRSVRKQERLPLEVNVIWAIENRVESETKSKNHPRLSWLILTLDKITTPNEVIEKVQQYSKRWLIEIFHKLIKTGFRIERCCLNTANRLSKYIKTVCIAAFRLFELTYLNRSEPQSPCTKILSEAEYKAVVLLKTGKPKLPSKKPHTIREVVHWIAEIGGYWGRKGDPEPGIITIWQGWQTINPIAHVMEGLCPN